ncbi:hypothetical protein GARC_2047 [Paraglaciecola arctica BSs20135]|uniref:Uncharacterized protein n=1 Tax=Paraglaciecola arctica BSs20135 TaxID=493475 RepID=K6XEE9_9ALTE|nr:hypothetical protein GARC_2047 [Paraglaciecola arctica BSs20135]
MGNVKKVVWEKYRPFQYIAPHAFFETKRNGGISYFGR